MERGNESPVCYRRVRSRCRCRCLHCSTAQARTVRSGGTWKVPPRRHRSTRLQRELGRRDPGGARRWQAPSRDRQLPHPRATGHAERLVQGGVPAVRGRSSGCSGLTRTASNAGRQGEACRFSLPSSNHQHPKEVFLFCILQVSEKNETIDSNISESEGT